MAKQKRKQPQRLSAGQKLAYLQSRLPGIAHKWRKVHPKNIVAFRAGKKKVKGKETPVDSIIIQVIKKKEEKQLKKDQRLPKHIRVKFPDGKFQLIPTDVIETGAFEFHFGITDEVDSLRSPHFGTAGLFVTDNRNRVFMLTNYHVVAEDLMSRNIFSFRRQNGDNTLDVRLRSGNGSVIDGMFTEGMLSRSIDAAFTFLSIPANGNLNRLPDGGRVQGRITNRPIPASFVNRPVVVYSFSNPRGITSVISDNSAVLFTSNPNIFFEDVIQLHPRVTQGGDSGSIVVTPSGAALGIIVGADPDFSYVIPIYKINDFKNFSIP